MASAKERPNAALPDGEVLPQTGGEFPATRARFKHPSMDVNYKRKECLWSKSPGYFFFLATLRPPPTTARHFLLSPLDQSQRALDDSCQWETGVYVSANHVRTQLYIDLVGWSTTPKHYLRGSSFIGCFLFFFLLILTTSILVSVNIVLRCWQRWLLKLFVFFIF